MDSGEECLQMAETLIVLAGENAWLAAREFGSEAARDGNRGAARHWRNVARVVLRKHMERLGSRSEKIAAPGASAEVEASATPSERVANGPIPLRARRQSTPQPAPADAGAHATDVQAKGADAEFAIAKAA